VTLGQFAAANLVIAAGALLQGSVGFGLALVAAPLLVLIDPRLVPGPLLMASLALTTLVTWRDFKSVRLADLGWSLPGRVVGTAVAVAALSVVPERRLQLLLGLVMLVSTGLAASRIKVAPNPLSLFGAGTMAGVTGTLTSIGGPPMALIYRDETGPRLRGTLNAFFVFGVTISLIGLALSGHFGREQALLALALMPGAPVGFVLSKHTAGVLDGGYTKPVILALSGLAAALVVIKAL
jgi:hypothetical protein